MIYIYDILVNFNDIEKIYEFFEWNTNDDIEHIKKITLMKVPPKTLTDLFLYQIRIGNDTLKKIYRTTEVFMRNKIAKLEYASLFTDGTRVLAIEFNERGESIFKSKLLLDEEEDVSSLSSKLAFEDVEYECLSKTTKRAYLTRKEESIKKFLLKELVSAYQEEDYKKLKFIYEEYSDQEELDYKKMYKDLVESMTEYLNQNHLRIYELLKLSHQKKQV